MVLRFFLAASLGLALGPAVADTLKLKDGTVHEGRKVGATKTKLAFKIDGKLTWFKLSDVAEVVVEERKPAPPPRKATPAPKPAVPANPQSPPPATPLAKPKTVTNSIGMRLTWIPPGTYTMGAPPGSSNEIASREDMRKVAISEGFYLGTCEVTQKQWKAVTRSEPWLKASPSRRPKMGDDLPAVCVTWRQAAEFCKRLSSRESRRYRLPHEVEWEYACRAGTTTPFYTGDAIAPAQANFDPLRGQSGDARLRDQRRGELIPVGTLPPNPWGLHNMAGNASELCRRYVKPQPFPVDDPSNTVVTRGGAWRWGRGKCRSAHRILTPLSHENELLGFRVLLDAKGTRWSAKAIKRPAVGQPRGRPRHRRP